MIQRIRNVKRKQVAELLFLMWVPVWTNSGTTHRLAAKGTDCETVWRTGPPKNAVRWLNRLNRPFLGRTRVREAWQLRA